MTTDTPESLPVEEVLSDFPLVGTGAFTNKDETIISYNGANYYKACNRMVVEYAGEDGKDASFCVKRVDHPGDIHEDFDGNEKWGNEELGKEMARVEGEDSVGD